MSNQVTRIEDLSPEQLRAQVRLCFKFMGQCLDLLNGEDIADEAAIHLVDPIGDSTDMELFYKCKSVGGAGDLADAFETIDRLNKKVEKLKKRLAKKHDEIEDLKSKNAHSVCFGIKFDTKQMEKALMPSRPCVK